MVICMEIEELFEQLKHKLDKEWSGSYYLYTSEGHTGVQVSGFEKIPQNVGIEVLNPDHPDKQQMEMELLRMTNGTEWVVSSDGFFKDGHSGQRREIFFEREIEHDGSIFQDEFEKSVEL